MNLTFRILLNINFKRVNINLFENYLYCLNRGLDPRQKNICSRNFQISNENFL